MLEEMDEPGLGKYALLALHRPDLEHDTSAFFSGSSPGR
jgi:hypothetical protein